MRKIIIILFFLGLNVAVLSQNTFKTITLVARSIPSNIKYKGNLKMAIKWTDKLGEHILITTETGAFENPIYEDEQYNDAEIYAYHFINKYNTYEQTWMVYDFEKKCNFDVYANYIPNTLQLTDLNNNGIAEIWLIYKTNCTSDVSPFNMKIIMYEGDKKHVIKGKNKVQTGDNTFLGGKYLMDKDFYKSPKEIKDFAKKLWEDNVMNVWD